MCAWAVVSAESSLRSSKCGCALRRSKCEGHDDAVRVLAVAGGKVFSGSYDGSIGVW